MTLLLLILAAAALISALVPYAIGIMIVWRMVTGGEE